MACLGHHLPQAVRRAPPGFVLAIALGGSNVHYFDRKGMKAACGAWVSGGTQVEQAYGCQLCGVCRLKVEEGMGYPNPELEGAWSA